MVTLLPAPFEPTRPKTSPGATSIDKTSTAVKDPKRRVSALVQTAGFPDAGDDPADAPTDVAAPSTDGPRPRPTSRGSVPLGRDMSRWRPLGRPRCPARPL